MNFRLAAGAAPPRGLEPAAPSQPAQSRVGPLLDQLDAELARQQAMHSQPWLLGAAFSAVDIYAMMLCRWTRNFASSPARNRPHLGPYLQRVLARPAVIRAFAVEGLAQPWV